MKHIIVTGGPNQGFQFWGPFKSAKEAEDYIEAHERRLPCNFWIAELEKADDLGYK